MDAKDVLSEARKGLEELEREREKVLKRAALTMLELTLPAEVKGGYIIEKSTKQASIKAEKINASFNQKAAQATTDVGLKGKVQEGADQVLKQLDQRDNYGQGVGSIK
ncbi:hypothetical protein LFYK43_16240 [Ligilactobacillus salitolerans]|uniref:Uncharacterized protein n=1 Tax=Ligilactobacillus salitolerans TaxID=1808352 RepID=A0A401IUH9_9LACO|nr:hypothetical protein [Ligilactobacillus salitolerans]GBG95165.1 hypothetical protein LFYK43_16240 [Ligilactobacillus salitolerans]